MAGGDSVTVVTGADSVTAVTGGDSVTAVACGDSVTAAVAWQHCHRCGGGSTAVVMVVAIA